MDVGNLADIPGGLASQYCWKRGRFQCNCPRQLSCYTRPRLRVLLHQTKCTPSLCYTKSCYTRPRLRDLCPLPLKAIKFSLSVGFEYVFTESFMQDVIEDYFGHQRTKRGRSDNTSAQHFGYNDPTIAAQRDIPKN